MTHAASFVMGLSFVILASASGILLAGLMGKILKTMDAFMEAAGGISFYGLCAGGVLGMVCMFVVVEAIRQGGGQ